MHLEGALSFAQPISVGTRQCDLVRGVGFEPTKAFATGS